MFEAKWLGCRWWKVLIITLRISITIPSTKNSSDVNTYQSFYAPQVLRYDKKTETYGYSAVNFGACKGETFERVMIVPNGPLTKFITQGTALKSPEKYYVAVTRPKYSIAIVLPQLPNTLSGYEEVLIECGRTQIRALKYIASNWWLVKRKQ